MATKATPARRATSRKSPKHKFVVLDVRADWADLPKSVVDLPDFNEIEDFELQCVCDSLDEAIREVKRRNEVLLDSMAYDSAWHFIVVRPEALQVGGAK